jgi:hypothetical protein
MVGVWLHVLGVVGTKATLQHQHHGLYPISRLECTCTLWKLLSGLYMKSCRTSCASQRTRLDPAIALQCHTYLSAPANATLDAMCLMLSAKDCAYAHDRHTYLPAGFSKPADYGHCIASQNNLPLPAVETLHDDIMPGLWGTLSRRTSKTSPDNVFGTWKRMAGLKAAILG